MDKAEKWKDCYYRNILHGATASVIPDNSFFEDKARDNTTSSVSNSFSSSGHEPWYEATLNLYNYCEKISKRLEKCENDITDNQKKIDSIDQMCQSVRSLSNLIYKIAIGITIAIIAIVAIIFYITRAGIITNAALLIVGAIGGINLFPIFSIPNKIKEIEKDISDLKSKVNK